MQFLYSYVQNVHKSMRILLDGETCTNRKISHVQLAAFIGVRFALPNKTYKYKQEQKCVHTLDENGFGFCLLSTCFIRTIFLVFMLFIVTAIPPNMINDKEVQSNVACLALSLYFLYGFLLCA